jgi:biotin-(acetyl-CoA carboxylase) ligase
LPLLAGLYDQNRGQVLARARSGAQWPNDVLVGEKKISGGDELIGDQSGVVIGAGLNLLRQQTDLPIDNATHWPLRALLNRLNEVLSGYLLIFVNFIWSGFKPVATRWPQGCAI